MYIQPASGRRGRPHLPVTAAALPVLVVVVMMAPFRASRADEQKPLTTAAVMPVEREPGFPPPSGGLPAIPSPGELEARGAVIGAVTIRVDDIFDEDDPEEDLFLYRLANDLKVSTRESTVREMLLLQPGDVYSERKTEEAARLMRARKYLADAEVIPVQYHPESNTVDMQVRVRDIWTLEPGIGFGRSGGSNSSRLRLADEDLFGFGQKLALTYKSDVDRSGLGVQFIDPNLFQTWWGLDADYTDNSDGRTAALGIGKPFYSLDQPWSLGMSGAMNDQVTPTYVLGEKVSEFSSEYRDFGVQGGLEDGLYRGWTKRWLAGYRYSSASFSDSTDPAVPTGELPEDRRLSYPFVGVELIEDAYVRARNRDLIGRTEDVFLGRHFLATIGWASPALGSDRSAGIFSIGGDMGRALTDRDELQLAANWDGRLESGNLVDALLEASSRYYHRFDEKNVFMAYTAAAFADRLSLDRQLQLGGDNGLRGYPLRYQTGTTRAQFTVEERYFTDWYPFRLFRVGAAVFADAGRMWGGDPETTGPQDWLSDVGFGLRFGNMKSGAGGSVLHVDLAFPLSSSDDIDSMQLLLEAHKSF